MRKKDKELLLIGGGFTVWFFGSIVIGGALHELSASSWMNDIIAFLVIAWTAFIVVVVIWLWNKV